MSALTVPNFTNPATPPVNELDQYSFLLKCEREGDARKQFTTDTAEQLLGDCPKSRVLLVRVRHGAMITSYTFRREQIAELTTLLSANTGRCGGSISTIWTIVPNRLAEYETLPSA